MLDRYPHLWFLIPRQPSTRILEAKKIARLYWTKCPSKESDTTDSKKMLDQNACVESLRGPTRSRKIQVNEDDRFTYFKQAAYSKTSIQRLRDHNSGCYSACKSKNQKHDSEIEIQADFNPPPSRPLQMDVKNTRFQDRAWPQWCCGLAIEIAESKRRTAMSVGRCKKFAAI